MGFVSRPASRQQLISITKGDAIRICDLETTRIPENTNIYDSVYLQVRLGSSTLFVSHDLYTEMASSVFLNPPLVDKVKLPTKIFGMKIIVSSLIRGKGYIII